MGHRGAEHVSMKRAPPRVNQHYVKLLTTPTTMPKTLASLT
jgi:hypothetical protein